jgi:hypothetical protein
MISIYCSLDAQNLTAFRQVGSQTLRTRNSPGINEWFG